ncbi:MAG TPA: bL21 family ribosomal protein [Candidatus Saccharimonadales bacterium]|nr:bL21 family ribosomal protein [Candidatus Saccharimonadales bacterium]
MATSEDNNKQWAVVAVGGKDHLVAEGSKLTVNKLDLEVDKTLVLDSALDKLPVTLKVVAHKLGEKIHGFKFKNKVRYTRHYGHRQKLTVLEVLAIGNPKSVTVKAEVKSEKKDAVTKKPAAKKAVAKKIAPLNPPTGGGGKKPVAKKEKNG